MFSDTQPRSSSRRHLHRGLCRTMFEVAFINVHIKNNPHVRLCILTVVQVTQVYAFVKICAFGGHVGSKWGATPEQELGERPWKGG